MCNVLLTSQLSFKCSVLIHQSTHLLLQSSHCIFHWDRVGSHVRAKGSKVKGQLVTSRHSQQSRDNLRLVSHHQQRVPHSFQRQPVTSSTLAPTNSALVPDSQHTVAIARGQATNVLSERRNKEQRKRTQQRSVTMFAVYLLCVLRDSLCLTPVMGCANMDDHRACRVTSVHTLTTTTKRTENNKCSAVT